MYTYPPNINIHTYHYFQALAKFQTTTKITAKSGIEQEESLLSESAARETSLQFQIIELESETKQVCRVDQSSMK